MRTFVCVPAAEWVFNNGIDISRRRRLLDSIPFQEIVQQIRNNCTIDSCKRKPIKASGRGYYGAEIILRVECATVDLFHNSASGYRAQYYESVETGEACNQYCIGQLVPRVMELLNGTDICTVPLAWVKLWVANYGKGRFSNVFSYPMSSVTEI